MEMACPFTGKSTMPLKNKANAEKSPNENVSTKDYCPQSPKNNPNSQGAAEEQILAGSIIHPCLYP
jgi:hypothetical protein